MKVHGTIEISGVERIVINGNTVWNRELHRGKYVWRKEHTNVHKSDEVMLRRVQGFIDSDIHNVWFHNGTWNIEKIPWEIDIVEVRVQPRKGKDTLMKEMKVLERGVATACDYHR